MSILPTPKNFPITWDPASDQKSTWRWDKLHAPRPFTPMCREIICKSFSNGYNNAFTSFYYDVKSEVKFFNCYLFKRIEPNTNLKEVKKKGKQCDDAIHNALINIMEHWNEKYLPEINQHNRYMESFDVDSASLTELKLHFVETLKRIDRLWEIHFLVMFPAICGPVLFQEYFQDLFPNADEFESLELLSGFENQSIRTGIALWKMAQEAKKSAIVEAILRNFNPEQSAAELEKTQEGRQYLERLKAMLQIYGKRSSESLDLIKKTWVEDPSTAIKDIQLYLVGNTPSIEEDLKRIRVKRDEKVRVYLEKLKHYPEDIRNEFNTLLNAGVAGTVLKEDHNYEIDMKCIYNLRRVLIPIGRKFTRANMLDQAEDILYLFPNEVISCINENSTTGFHELVKERKSQMEKYANVEVPDIVGTAPQALLIDNSINRALIKSHGGPPRGSEDPNVLLGNAASPGIVEGIARIIINLEDAGRIKPGEILITETTTPSWTPLFATSKAIVTETGGVLSHCAITAREYHVAAVVGVSQATKLIKDGMRIKVDGRQGRIDIIS